MTDMSTYRLDDGGIPISYEEGGRPDSLTVVLLHSLGADGRMWNGCLKRLVDEYRVIVPDSRGHGASGPATTASVELWTSDLKRVLDAAAVDAAVLVGVSLGGIQALAFAAQYPSRVSALAVADSFVALPPEVARDRIRRLNDQTINNTMDEFADQYVADTFERPFPPGAEAVRRAIADMDSTSYRTALEACFGVQIEDLLALIEVPTVVMWGDRDTKTPRTLSENIAAGLKDSRLVTIPAAGHLSCVDNPEGFVDEFMTFIAAHCAEPIGLCAQGGH